MSGLTSVEASGESWVDGLDGMTPLGPPRPRQELLGIARRY